MKYRSCIKRMRYKKEPLIKNILLNIRRFYYIIFRRRYVERSVENRKGNCGCHGCCRTRIYSCKWMEYKTNKCTLWKGLGYDGLPTLCKILPFDEKDKTEFNKNHCNFYWN